MQPHCDDPMVVVLRIENYDLKRVLIDQGSSADVIYFDAYERMGLTIDLLKPFPGTLVGFSNEEVEILGYIQSEVIFGTRSSPE